MEATDSSTLHHSRNVWTFPGAHGLYIDGRQAWNCIVHGTSTTAYTNYTANHENVFQSGGVLGYSCAPLSTIPNGVSNVFFRSGVRVSRCERLRPPTRLAVHRLRHKPSRRRHGPVRCKPARGTATATAWRRRTWAPWRPRRSTRGRSAPTSPSRPRTRSAGHRRLDRARRRDKPDGLVLFLGHTHDGTPDQTGSGRPPRTYPDPVLHGFAHGQQRRLGDGNSGEAGGGPGVRPRRVRGIPRRAASFRSTRGPGQRPNLQAAIDAAAPGHHGAALGTGLRGRQPADSAARVDRSAARTAPPRRPSSGAAPPTPLFLVIHSNAILERLTLRNGSWQSSAWRSVAPPG